MKLYAAALCLLLTGCTFAAGPDSFVDRRAAALFGARIAYLGDFSRVALLVNEVEPTSVGSQTIELQTARPPLGLTINLGQLAEPFASIDFSESATVLIGLIANVEEVSRLRCQETRQGPESARGLPEKDQRLTLEVGAQTIAATHLLR